jgi:uncharacterized membrane protein HdeD (DUF308 family)
MKMRPKNRVENIILGLLTALWGLALLIFGPFYSRGYQVPRSIGVLFLIFGVWYVLYEFFKKEETNF